jgi:hypothetical protein
MKQGRKGGKEEERKEGKQEGTGEGKKEEKSEGEMKEKEEGERKEFDFLPSVFPSFRISFLPYVLPPPLPYLLRRHEARHRGKAGWK